MIGIGRPEYHLSRRPQSLSLTDDDDTKYRAADSRHLAKKSGGDDVAVADLMIKEEI